MFSKAVNLFLITGISAMMLSCSTGPSKADLAAWQVAREANTQNLVNFFIEEIWTKPISELRKEEMIPLGRYSAGRITSREKWIPLPYPIVSYGKLTPRDYQIYNGSDTTIEDVAGCNPNWETPNLIAYMNSSPNPTWDAKEESWNFYKEKERVYKFDFGHDDKVMNSDLHEMGVDGKPNKSISIPCDDGFDRNISRGVRGNYDEGRYIEPYFKTPSLSASTIIERLKAKGVPLDYCYNTQEDMSILRGRGIPEGLIGRETMRCFFDGHSHRGEEPARQATLKIVTVGGDLLVSFSFDQMHVYPEEEHKSFAEIYSERLKNEDYRNFLISYMNIAKVQSDKWEQYEIEQELGAQRAKAAYKRRSQALWNEALSGGLSQGITAISAPSNLDRIQQQTMDNIRANERQVRSQQQSAKSSGSSSATSQTSTYRKPASIRPQKMSAYEAEKANCINAGKKWQSTGGCDYSTTVTVQGWSEGNQAVVQRPSTTNNSTTTSGRRIDPDKKQGYGNTQGGTGTTNTSGANSGVNSGTNSSGRSAEKIKRYIPVFVQREGISSWETEEDSCYYAKAAAIRTAENRCNSEHDGRTAYKSEAPIPIDANCQSCRQVSSGNWKCTGNVILQCILP
jgi:hypothetical protein